VRCAAGIRAARGITLSARGNNSGVNAASLNCFHRSSPPPHVLSLSPIFRPNPPVLPFIRLSVFYCFFIYSHGNENRYPYAITTIDIHCHCIIQPVILRAKITGGLVTNIQFSLTIPRCVHPHKILRDPFIPLMIRLGGARHEN